MDLLPKLTFDLSCQGQLTQVKGFGWQCNGSNVCIP